ncbi:MAG: hypothetical protein IKN65_09415 [Clostridia bacterium]|nr:hypothetical protein [Clostridia bacterium]
MNKLDALEIVNRSASKVLKKNINLSFESNIKNENIFDSFDIMLFFIELEDATGLVVPDNDELFKNDWYSVEKICREIVKVR